MTIRFNRMVVRKSTLEQIHAKCSVDGKPPCLEDVLELYSRRAFLNIEVKVRGMEQVVVQAVRRFPPQRGYFISSFLPSVVRKLHDLDSSLVLGAISKSYWHLRRWKALPVSYVVPHHGLLTPKLVDELHAAGKTVITWTVNDSRRMLRAAAMGVDGIISDDTKLLVETLGKMRVNTQRIRSRRVVARPTGAPSRLHQGRRAKTKPECLSGLCSAAKHKKWPSCRARQEGRITSMETTKQQA